MKTIKGCLIKYAIAVKFDVIIHGCNCFNTMGGGIAYHIKKQFPMAYTQDCKTIKGDKNKLGSYTFCKYKINNKELVIVNGYTQYKYWGNEPNVDYDATRSLFRKIKNDFSGKKIGFPMIGAGLAGGNWEIIKKIIEEELEELEDMDYTLVEYN